MIVLENRYYRRHIVFFFLFPCKFVLHQTSYYSLYALRSVVKKGYNNFVQMNVTGRKRRGRPHKEYIFLFRITNQLATSVCPFV